MKRYSKRVLRVHGTAIVILGIALTVVGWIGTYHGAGVMAMLKEQPLAYIGLFQAYLLMSTLGVALWIGSYSEDTRRWHVIGFLAHSSPLAANLVFWDLIARYGISHAGIAIHVVFMLVEAVAFLGYHRGSD